MNEIKGNLLTELESGRLEIIGHCCNCQTHMGAGIARTLKEKWPQVFQADLDFDAGLNPTPQDRLGNVSIAKVGDKRYVANLYGQLRYGSGKRQVNYEALYNSLESMRAWAYDLRLKKVGFPKKMGADRAGGSSVIIETIIGEIFKESDGFEVKIVKLEE